MCLVRIAQGDLSASPTDVFSLPVPFPFSHQLAFISVQVSSSITVVLPWLLNLVRLDKCVNGHAADWGHSDASRISLFINVQLAASVPVFASCHRLWLSVDLSCCTLSLTVSFWKKRKTACCVGLCLPHRLSRNVYGCEHFQLPAPATRTSIPQVPCLIARRRGWASSLIRRHS